MSSDCISQYEYNGLDLSQYASIVIYRSSQEDNIKRIYNRYHWTRRFTNIKDQMKWGILKIWIMKTL